ncbi:MAG: hypothetical protein ACXVFN_00855 [Solirubrobacteraceae bacterium]
MAALVTGPAAAQAVTINVTGDDGNPVALTGPLSIRYLNPEVSLTLGSGEHYGYTITGPGGQQAAVQNSCASSGSTRLVNYFGNGAYTVHLTQYAAPDTYCSKAPTRQSDAQFSINASLPVGPGPKRALTRNPGSYVTNHITLPASVNPGGISNQVFYGVNSAIAPDGGIATPAGQAYPNASTGTVDIPLDKGPGVYQVTGRAEGFNDAGDVFTPWSPVVSFPVYVPFDIKKLSFPDARGPSYRLKATFNETSVTGRVSIALARGTKGGTYHSLGSVTVRHHSVSKRFSATRPGNYRVRFKFKGNRTVAPGYEVDRIHITRRVFFRSASAAALRR